MKSDIQKKDKKYLTIYRDGSELGSWPYDIVISLFRIGHLKEDDLFKINDIIDNAQPLSSAIPPSPVHGKNISFTGRENDEDPWVFYRKEGSDIIGPIPFSTIWWRIICGDFKDEDLLFIVGADRWRTTSDFVKTFMENDEYDISKKMLEIRKAFAYFSWPKFFQDIKNVLVTKKETSRRDDEKENCV
ncbi:MAG: hypothetical protein WAL87_00420 [Chthoniobacterales bacterium]